MTSSGENNPEPNNQLIQQLAAGLNSTSALIQGLLREIRENSLTLASFEGELSGLQRTVTSLNRVLQEGDGKASILTRVALLESTVAALAKNLEVALEEQKVEAAQARVESTALIKQEREGRVKVRLGKLQMVGVIAPAVLAFILSVLALILK
jgi:hypothetical protein